MFKKNRPATKDSKIGLQKISGCDNYNRKADVVFVHGLGGHALSTWHPQEKSDKNSWPFWLGEELPDIGIWSFGYKAEFSGWKGKTTPRFDKASNLLHCLEIDRIGERPLIFITHSLGGLLVKQMLRTAQTYQNTYQNKDYIQALIENTKGIVFLATPHTGSQLANTVAILRRLLRTTVNVDELKAHNPWLRELDQWYRNQIDNLGVTTLVYYESQKTSGYKVVDEDSADPKIPGVMPVEVTADHISIAKPSREGEVYRGVRHFIQQYLSTPSPIPLCDLASLEAVKQEELTKISNP